MRDCILVKGLHCSLRIGVKKEEQEVRRNCELDVSVYYDLTAAGSSDDLDLTLDYMKVVRLIRDLESRSQYKLLEAFAYQLFKEIFHHTPAKRVRIRLKKLNPPIEGRFEYLGVQMIRNREDFIP